MPRAETSRSTHLRPRAIRTAADPNLPPALRGATPVATVPVTATEFPALAQDPNAYASVVEGDCLTPVVFSGDLVLVSPAAALKVGEFVVLHPHEGRPLVKRLVVAPPPFEFAPGSDAEGLVIVEQLNPPHTYHVPTRMLHSIHAVAGVMPRARHEAVRVPVQAVAAGAGGPIPGAMARRGLLATAAALMALPAGAKGADLHLSAPHPDAEVMRLAMEFLQLERQHREQADTSGDEAAETARLAQSAELMDRQQDIADALLDLPAHTLDGNRALARCLAAWSEPDDYGRDGYVSDKLIGALLLSLVGRVPLDAPEEDEPAFIPAPAATRAMMSPSTMASRCELLTRYDAWLERERRELMRELHPGLDPHYAMRHVPCERHAARFHDQAPPPSTRAAEILGQAGVFLGPDLATPEAAS